MTSDSDLRTRALLERIGYYKQLRLLNLENAARANPLRRSEPIPPTPQHGRKIIDPKKGSPRPLYVDEIHPLPPETVGLIARLKKVLVH